MPSIVIISLLSLVPYCACVVINTYPYQQAIIQAHNYYRRNEPASNMRRMVWDPYLEQRARQWGETCYFEHQRRGLGENLSYFTSTGRPLPPRAVIQRSIGLWAAEKRLYRWSRGCGAACHYTQLVWARTSKVGCSLSFCPILRVGRGSLQRNGMYFVCFYSPAGNYVGQYPFIPGPRCSRCGRGEACIGGLCGGRRFGRGRRSVKMTNKDEFLGLVKEKTEGM